MLFRSDRAIGSFWFRLSFQIDLRDFWLNYFLFQYWLTSTKRSTPHVSRICTFYRKPEGQFDREGLKKVSKTYPTIVLIQYIGLSNNSYLRLIGRWMVDSEGVCVLCREGPVGNFVYKIRRRERNENLSRKLVRMVYSSYCL